MTSTTRPGHFGREVPVHKKDQEGVLMISGLTGIITTAPDDYPEWATGLALANLTERHAFYNTRMGDLYTTEHAAPEMFAFEDLEWLGVEEDGETTYTVEADAEFRQEVIAAFVSGVEKTWETTAEHDVSMDRLRTDEQAEAIEQAGGKLTATG